VSAAQTYASAEDSFETIRQTLGISIREVTAVDAFDSLSNVADIRRDDGAFASQTLLDDIWRAFMEGAE